MKGVRKIATTGIWKIEKRLDNVIDYTTNIERLSIVIMVKTVIMTYTMLLIMLKQIIKQKNNFMCLV